MNISEFIAQAFGIAGLVLTVFSFQEKNNKKFFIMQALAGLMFFMNFSIIGAWTAALFNLTNLVRGALLSKNDKKLRRLFLIEALYTTCFIIGLATIIGIWGQIFVSTLTYIGLFVMTVFMWRGNGKHIRYTLLFVTSPAWIIHNIYNFSLGGLLCEIFSMFSVIISFIRFGKKTALKNSRC